MRIKSILAVALSLCLLCGLFPLAVSAASENLASNGDLELGTTSGWDIKNATMVSVWELPDSVYAGNYALVMMAMDPYQEAALKTVPVRKNATVTVSFYYYYHFGGGNYHVFTYKGADTYVGTYANADVSLSRGSTWTKATYTFNSGDYDYITLKFSPNGAGASGQCVIDNLVVTMEGGDIPTNEKPTLTSFGTKLNRPKDATSNLIENGGFESTAGAPWNTSAFIKGNLQVVEDATAPEGNHSLYLSGNSSAFHTFPVTVEPGTQYVFSAWVKSPRLSDNNNATATFGVMDTSTTFMVYDPYNGNGNGAASISTKKMQLMATSPDDEWHLRSVTFKSGSYTTVYIGVYGVDSQLYLDDIALYKLSNGVEYISSLRTDSVSAANTAGNQYCADEDSLIQGIYMTSNDAQLTWSDNPAWRNGFLSFEDSGDSHGTALKYTASAKTNLKLHYIDWIDVTPNTDYTLTLDVKRLAKGDGRIALLDDNYSSPVEFYTIHLAAVDSDWATYSVTFNTKSFSRIGFAIVDGGGSALIDEVRLFETSKGVADKPVEEVSPTLKPVGIGTAVMEMEDNCLGVAFLMELEGYYIYRTSRFEAELHNATVIPYDDGEAYSLLHIGTIVTNDAAVGTNAEGMTRAEVNDFNVLDVPIVYLWSVSEDGCQFAVRVTNVPADCADTQIYVRPYYVFEKDGEEIVVYGDVYHRSYNG